MRNLCFGPLGKKWGIRGGWCFVSSSLFHCQMLRGWLTLALGLCAWEPSLGSRLHFSQGEALTAVLYLGLLPMVAVPVLSRLHPSYRSHGGICLSLVSSSSSLWLFILSCCSPLYFQLGSGRRCEIDPPTPLPSYLPIMFTF